MNFKPRPYQEKAIQIGIEVLKGKRKEVLVEPTGAGKSWIIGGICKELSNDKILVIQPTFELLEQNVSKINALGVEVDSLASCGVCGSTFIAPFRVNNSFFRPNPTFK